jgi:hypothetical protein
VVGRNQRDFHGLRALRGGGATADGGLANSRDLIRSPRTGDVAEGDFTVLANGLMIFGKARRCLHDRVAVTKVELVRPKRLRGLQKASFAVPKASDAVGEVSDAIAKASFAGES